MSSMAATATFSGNRAPAWPDRTIRWCHDADRITNGRIEGTNNKLGVLKQVAYGFVNPANFAPRALLLTPGMPTSP